MQRYLLNKEISPLQYQQYASKMHGHPSTATKNLGGLMFLIAVIAAIGVLAVPGNLLLFPLAIAAASTLIGIFACIKSGRSGFSKEANDIVVAYEEQQILTTPLGPSFCAN